LQRAEVIDLRSLILFTLPQGAKQRKFTAQALAALYMVVVTAFYFLSSSYPCKPLSTPTHTRWRLSV
jgi:hypothetical protein